MSELENNLLLQKERVCIRASGTQNSRDQGDDSSFFLLKDDTIFSLKKFLSWSSFFFSSSCSFLTHTWAGQEKGRIYGRKKNSEKRKQIISEKINSFPKIFFSYTIYISRERKEQWKAAAAAAAFLRTLPPFLHSDFSLRFPVGWKLKKKVSNS